MHSIADVSLRENGTKKKKVGWDEVETKGAQDEAPSPSKQHRRRKEVNSPRSVLFKSLYRAEKKDEGEKEKGRENEREREGERKREDALL